MTTGLPSFSGRAFSLRGKLLPVPGGRLAVDCGKHPAHVAGIAEASLLGDRSSKDLHNGDLRFVNAAGDEAGQKLYRYYKDIKESGYSWPAGFQSNYVAAGMTGPVSIDLYAENSTVVELTGDANWNARADVNRDGVVDINDLILIMNHYSK